MKNSEFNKGKPVANRHDDDNDKLKSIGLDEIMLRAFTNHEQEFIDAAKAAYGYNTRKNPR